MEKKKCFCIHKVSLTSHLYNIQKFIIYTLNHQCINIIITKMFLIFLSFLNVCSFLIAHFLCIHTMYNKTTSCTKELNSAS